MLEAMACYAMIYERCRVGLWSDACNAICNVRTLMSEI